MSARPALQKLTVHSYADRNFAEDSKVAVFVIPINPETFTRNYKIELDQRRGHGNQGTDPRFKSTVPEEFKIEFVLDGTYTMEGYRFNDENTRTVQDQLKAFLACVYKMEGEIHRPRFLKLFWGEDLKFPCVLSNLDINYTLFNPDGTPLRVKINATFLNYLAQQARTNAERQASPDLTHYRKVTAGDRLDQMTYKIYNDSRYFLQVAKANRLTNLRSLKTGADLYFPPFSKEEA